MFNIIVVVNVTFFLYRTGKNNYYFAFKSKDISIKHLVLEKEMFPVRKTF